MKIHNIPKIVKFLQGNYDKLGIKECSERLGISYSYISQLAKEHNIKLSSESSKKRRAESSLKRSLENSLDFYTAFAKINSPEKAYVLGYLWADGYLSKHDIQLIIALEDMEEIKDVLIKSANWKIYPRKSYKKTKCKPMCTIIRGGKSIVDLFTNMGYKEKSRICASSVLKFIPEDLHFYWYRGLFDGDGCIYSNKKSNWRSHVQIASTFKQDWTYMEKILNKLSIKYSLYRRTDPYKYKGETRMGKFSLLMICGCRNIEKFFNFIYPDNKPNFGLKRKYNRFIELFKRPKTKYTKITSYVENPDKYYFRE